MSLKQIRGIGAVKQSWLRQVLNIRSISDLAVADAETIAARLQESGHLISVSEISGWITQAQLLFRDDLNDSESTPSVSMSADSTVDDPTATPWQTIAMLTLEYQTRQVDDRIESRTIARHQTQEMLPQRTPEVFSGDFPDVLQSDSTMHQEDIVEWVRQQLRECTPGSSPPTREESAIDVAEVMSMAQLNDQNPDVEPDSSSVMLELTDLQSQQSIVCSQPFTLEVTLQLVGIGAIDITLNKTTYVAKVELRDRMTGAIAILMTPPIPLIPEQLTYQIICPSVTLFSGLYRVQVQVEIPGLPPGCLKIPLLQVS